MKKAFKIIGKVLLGLLILIVLLLVILAVYNQIMLRKNRSLYETPLGQLVEVDGQAMALSHRYWILKHFTAGFPTITRSSLWRSSGTDSAMRSTMSGIWTPFSVRTEKHLKKQGSKHLMCCVRTHFRAMRLSYGRRNTLMR